MNHQRLYTYLLTVLLSMAAVGAKADGEWTSGSCKVKITGENMTVSGYGPMADYTITQTPWYAENLNVKKLVIEEGVTTVGTKAFTNFYTLESVTIPNSVTSIGDKAFVNCFKIKTLSLNQDSKLTTIGEAAFSHCEGLTAFTFPQNLSSVGDYSFEYCAGLKSFTIPQGMIFIPKGLFYGCSGLTTITIPASVTIINMSAFQGCKGLTTMTIPASVTTIAASAFKGCSGLTTITIPVSVTSIGDKAFGYCTAATNVYCYANPDSLLWRIDSADFKKGIQTDIHVINVEAWKKKYGNKLKHFVEAQPTVSGNCGAQGDNVKWFYYPGGHILFSGKGEMKHYEEMDQRPWFVKTPEIAFVLIKEGVTNISKLAFADCRNLLQISLPSTLKSIGRSAFPYCYKLKSIKLPKGLEMIDVSAFENCTSLTELYISDSVKTINEYAFSGCKGLKTVTFAEKSQLEVIPLWAFRRCYDLEKVNIPASVKTLGQEAFSSCYALKEVAIAAKSQLQTIESQAFKNNNELPSIIIPSGVTKIGDFTFSGCKVMTDVYCYADPEKLTWGNAAEDFMENKATKFHVADKTAWEKKFPNANVTFVGDLKANARGDENTEGTTRVSEKVTPTSEMATAQWYTLDGRKLTGKTTQKGIYIMNGKKIAIR